MRVPVTVFGLTIVACVGCSGNKPAATTQPPARQVSMQQLKVSLEGLAFVPGETGPFTGCAILKYPNGKPRAELNFLNGICHGTHREWDSIGQKRLEGEYVDGQRSGRATKWAEDGTVFAIEQWRDGRMLSVLNSAGEDVEAEAERIRQQRERLDKTLWKTETLAQTYEDTFVQLWDDLRAASDKWVPFEQLILGTVTLGTPQRMITHDWGITTTEIDGADQVLDRDGWLAWLKQWREQGIEIIETEWHQEAFATNKDQPHSTFNFTLHATGPDAMRYIVRGKLEIDWSGEQDHRKHFLPARIAAKQVRVLARQGKPPFSEFLRLEPARESPLGGTGFDTVPVMLYDLDRNGLSDIILPRVNLIFWNRGQREFEKDLLCEPYSMRLSGAVLADFTGDGRADLLGVQQDSSPVLFAGDDQGRFSGKPAVMVELTVAGLPNITAGDVDGDGDLDAWIAPYKVAYAGGQMPTPYYDANDGYPSYLLINDGRGRFADGTAAAGLEKKRFRRSYSCSFVDLDDDHDMDLVVISDFAGLDVYLNDGQGHFTDVSDRLGADRFSFGMSHALADFNGDGKLDLYMTGMGSTTARRLERMKLGRAEFPERQRARMKMAYGNRLLLGTGDFLAQASYNDLVARTGWSWGCTALDFDNDGDRDLYIANGNFSRRTAKDHCTTFWRHDIYTGTSMYNPALNMFFAQSRQCLETISWNGFEHNVLFMNERDKGSFVNVAFLMNLSHEYDSRAIISDDIDGDGLVDLVVTELGWDSKTGGMPEYLHVLGNDWQQPGHWIGVRLHEHGRGFTPVGAVITVRTGEQRQLQWVVTGDSFYSQHSHQKHFGLGATDKVDAIEVRWPNGKLSRLQNPAADQYHTVSPQ